RSSGLPLVLGILSHTALSSAGTSFLEDRGEKLAPATRRHRDYCFIQKEGLVSHHVMAASPNLVADGVGCCCGVDHGVVAVASRYVGAVGEISVVGCTIPKVHGERTASRRSVSEHCGGIRKYGCGLGTRHVRARPCANWADKSAPARS